MVTRNKSVMRLLFIVILVSLVFSNFGLWSEQSVYSQYLAFDTLPGCTVTDGLSRLNVDNTIGNGATHGCLIDYSSFPTAIVRVYNDHGFWTKITLRDNLNAASVANENIWAKFGYIAPDAYAEYRLTFNSKLNSRVMFFVNAAKSVEDDRPSAGWINTVFKILDVLGGIDLNAAELGDLVYVVDAASRSPHLILAADALSEHNLTSFLTEFHEALGDDTEIELIAQIAQRFGKTISVSAFKQIFRGVKIILTAKDILEVFAAIITGSYAGTVVFDSQVQSSPLPPQPPLDLPPLTGSDPLPTTNSATFVSDITYPDGTTVALGQALVKTWRVRNSGTSTWDGYKLKFVDGAQMQGPNEIIIPTTPPGATVDLTLNLVAPMSTGTQRGDWQIVNRSGTWVTGGQLWISVDVDTQSNGIILTADPPSPASADQVRIYARVNNFPNLRALRVRVDGQTICELGAPEIKDCTWHTNGYSGGQHTIVAEADDWIGASWDYPERKSLVYQLSGSGIVNHAPDRPTLQSPYDWYLKDAAGSPAPVRMCVSSVGDPDGDTVQYWFQLLNQIGDPVNSSGWIPDSCWEPTLDPNIYGWKVKTGDGFLVFPKGHKEEKEFLRNKWKAIPKPNGNAQTS